MTANHIKSGCLANKFYFRSSQLDGWPERWLWKSLKGNPIAALITCKARITGVQKLLIRTSSFSSQPAAFDSDWNSPGSRTVAFLQSFQSSFLPWLGHPKLFPSNQKCPSHNVIKPYFSSLPPVSQPLEKIFFPISEPPPFGELLFWALKSSTFFRLLPKKFNLLNHLIFISSFLLLPQWLKLVSGHWITRVLHFTGKADCWTVKKKGKKRQYVEHALLLNAHDGSFCVSWLPVNSECLQHTLKQRLGERADLCDEQKASANLTYSSINVLSNRTTFTGVM